MKSKPAQLYLWIVPVAVLIIGLPQTLDALQTKTPSLDVVIKISQLEKTLDLADELMGIASGKAGGTPTAFLRGMIQGTDWIDPKRLIVVAATLSDNKPIGIVLVPFARRNDNFQAAFNASRGLNYYILSLPMGNKNIITPAMETALVDISRTDAAATVTMELAAASLVKKFDPQIQAWLKKVGSSAAGVAAGSTGPSREEITGMMNNILGTARQVEVFSLGLDLSGDKLSSRLEARALKKSELAGLFIEGGKTSLMGSYLPEHHVTFRTRSFNVGGLVELVNASFGSYYSRIGLNFANVVQMSKHLTGETAGGSSFGKNQMNLEMITVLKDSATGSDFLEKVYLPWIDRYCQDMANLFKKQFQIEVEQIFVRTPDTTVLGHKVSGVKIKVPLALFSPQMSKTGQRGPEEPNLVPYEMRMATVGNLLLTAPDDKKMWKLIKTAKSLTRRTSRGPLMSVDIDTAGYLGAMAELLPTMPGGDRPMPDLGKMSYQFDMKDGWASGTLSMPIDDIKSLITHFKNGPPPAQKTHVTPRPKPVVKKLRVKKAPPKEASKPKPVKTVAKASEKDFAYWMDRGYLCSAYENDKAAVTYFDKAIKLDPYISEAYFQRGVSLGELAKYERALSSINRAIEMDSRQGLYYYGRGWIYLRSGDKVKAIEDFKRAARLGNRDAQNSLKNIFDIPWD
jgi:hypothetical protein